MPIHYVPPPPENLRELKTRLNRTGKQMADMFGLADKNQWHKYTGGIEPRKMSLPMLFLAFAVEHRDATVDEVFEICRRETGAIIEWREPSDSPAPDGELQP